MDKTIKECIDYLHDRDLLSECDYAALIDALDGYHEDHDAAVRLDNCKCKYLIGEKVYAKCDLLNTKNHITLTTIESIAYDPTTEGYIYNYLYREDELFSTEEELLAFLQTLYYKEYEEKINKVCKELKKLKERGDTYAKR